MRKPQTLVLTAPLLLLGLTWGQAQEATTTAADITVAEAVIATSIVDRQAGDNVTSVACTSTATKLPGTSRPTEQALGASTSSAPTVTFSTQFPSPFARRSNSALTTVTAGGRLGRLPFFIGYRPAPHLSTLTKRRPSGERGSPNSRGYRRL